MEEDVEKIIITDDIRIKFNPDRFRMAGVPAADLAVTGIRDMPADIAALDVAYSQHIVENRLDAPETATRERRDFLGHRIVSFPSCGQCRPRAGHRNQTAAVNRN
jgi:hypothetical protein